MIQKSYQGNLLQLTLANLQKIFVPGCITPLIIKDGAYWSWLQFTLWWWFFTSHRHYLHFQPYCAMFSAKTTHVSWALGWASAAECHHWGNRGELLCLGLTNTLGSLWYINNFIGIVSLNGWLPRSKLNKIILSSSGSTRKTRNK